MQYRMVDDATTVQITCAFEELVRMDSLNLAIYASPGEAQLYIGAAPHFRYDYLLATVDDFCAAEGWTSLGWEDRSEEDLEAVASDETTITVWCRSGR